jgi:putative transposase
MARVVVPGVPHHVTQRGNRRQTTFFEEGDYQAYKSLLAEWCLSSGVEVWAYCLMPNHVHLIVVPSTERALRAAIGEAHRRYTLMVNAREGWKGCLWQGRFFSFPMAPGHLFNGARYVELNPVRAGLVKRPEDWPHSSARAHLTGRPDGLVDPKALIERFGDWRALLAAGLPRDSVEEIHRHERTGRPLGDRLFVEQLEATVGRRLRPRPPGPAPTFRGHNTHLFRSGAPTRGS